MSHCVVVWEWRLGGAGGACWMPHGPGVARQLEHALAKGLTRVVLADVEPSLRGHYVNLRTLTQCTDGTEGVEDGCERRVRRTCYSAQSAAGRGVRWEWARVAAPPRRAELLYEPLPMETQCRLEEAWTRGADALAVDEWTVRLACMTARGAGGVVRLLRRAAQLPYPRARSPAPPPAPARRPHPLPPHHSQEQMAKQCEETSPECEGRRMGCEGGAAGGTRGPDRKPGFKHLLHNLNIFSHNRTVNVHVEAPITAPPAAPAPANASAAIQAPTCAAAEEARLDYDSSSTRSGRRHSVDTISTYLSHESKESLQPPVADLLDCSGSSDEAFAEAGEAGTGSETASEPAAWVRRVECVQWGAVCPLCVRALDARSGPVGGGGGGGGGVVALVHCQHMMHLHCLNEQLDRQRVRQEPLYVECGVCGRVYGARRVAATGGGGGEQPAGSMAWCVQPRALPGHAPHTASIVVTYEFASGVQCAAARHPAPGRPYYAVGFPRRSVLPDTALGRAVFGALRRAWERRRLFTVAASQTTGREHVVAWSAPPPPADRHQYALAAAAGDVDAPLRACLARLERLAPDA